MKYLLILFLVGCSQYKQPTKHLVVADDKAGLVPNGATLVRCQGDKICWSFEE